MMRLPHATKASTSASGTSPTWRASWTTATSACDASPGQAITPPRKPNKSALPDVHARWERDRHRHSSDRITVEHALADHKRWKQLTRWTHRQDRLPDTYRAIAGLVSDHTTII